MSILSLELNNRFWPNFIYSFILTHCVTIKRWLDFGDLDLIFRSPSYKDYKNQPFLHTIFWTRGWILTKLAWMHYQEGVKSWLDFGGLDLIKTNHICHCLTVICMLMQVNLQKFKSGILLPCPFGIFLGCKVCPRSNIWWAARTKLQVVPC